jgi:hypothetical protein
VFTALIARELGGRAKAQTLAAATFAVAGQFLGTGHYLATSTVDPFLWTVVLWLLVRWIRTRSDSLLVWIGVVTAAALYTKFLIGGFWLVAGIALLTCGPRELLRRPKLWLGAGIAIVALIPTLIWQATHGWPQLGMGAAISQEVGTTWGGRAFFVPSALLAAGIPVGAVLLCYGLWRLLRTPEYRFLGWTALGLTAVLIAADGRPYYIAGMYCVCWAMAAVEVERGQASRWWRWIATWPVYVLSAVLILPNALPVWPQSWLADHPSVPHPVFAFGEVGWPEGVRSIEQTFATLPDRQHTVVVTESYWEASAVDYYGRAVVGEPASPNRGYATLVTPPESARDVLYVGEDPRPLLGHFAGLRPVGKIETGLPGVFEGTPLCLATGRAEPWTSLWPKLINTHT